MNIRKGTINDVQLLHTIGVKTFDDTFGGEGSPFLVRFKSRIYYSLILVSCSPLWA
jgi:hypothetical protein